LTPDKKWTVLDLITWASGYFKEKGVASARLDAELLLAHALNTSRVRLYMESDKPLLPDELQQFKKLAVERVKGMSVAHIVGKRDFWKGSFFVSPGVFVPRPETEALVEFATKVIEADSLGPMLDLCSGSGNIAVSLAMEFAKAGVDAVEITEIGAKVIGKNAANHDVGDRVFVSNVDAIEFLENIDKRYVFVASNPPYVPEAEWAGLDPAITKFEPKGALTSGSDGLEMLREMIPLVERVLLPGGWFAFEYSGDSQTIALMAMMEAAGFMQSTVHKDYAGIDRMITGQRRG